MRSYKFVWGIIICWLISVTAGTGLGFVCSTYITDTYFLPIDLTWQGFLLSSVLPILLILFIFHFQLDSLLYPLLVLKGFIHAFSLSCIHSLFATVAWFDYTFSMVCQTTCCVMLLFVSFCFHSINKRTCYIVTASAVLVMFFLFLISLF